MFKIGKFGKSLIWQTVIKLFATALGLYTTRWLVSHTLSQEYNSYLIIIDFCQIILTIVEFGIPKMVQKFYTNPHKQIEIANFWATFSWLRIFSYFFGVVLIGISYRFSSIENLGLILAIFSLQFILLADLAFRSICDAKGHTWQFSLTDFGNRLVLVSGLIFYDLFKIEFNALNYFLIFTLISYTLGFLADSIWQKPFYEFGSFDIDILKKYLKPIFYLGLSGFTVALYLQTRKIILNSYGVQENLVNGFGNAEKIFSLATIVPGLTMPMIASMVKKRLDAGILSDFSTYLKKKFDWSITRSIITEWLSYTLVLSLALTLGMIIVGPLVIWLVDTEGKYQAAYSTLPILSLGMLPFTTVIFLANLIVFLGGEKYELYGTSILAVFGLGLYFLLIPQFGIYGASWATVIVFFVDLLLKLYFITKVLPKPEVNIYRD